MLAHLVTASGDLAGAIGKALPELRVSASPPDRICYSRDLWPRKHFEVRAGKVATTPPAAIVWPESAAQVAALVSWCAAEGVSLVPFGAGSGVCGGVLPAPRTVVVDLKRLCRWRIDRDAGVIDVGAGALGIRLEEDLERDGFTIGHFPSSILCSTVGGWVAARGAGQCSGRYGKIEDMVAALDVVDGRGETATLQRRTHGPDLTRLLIGSEGVLGVITAAKLRLHPAPRERAFAAFSFASIERGWEAIRALYQEGLRPAVCRLYDPFDSMLARRGARKASSLGERPQRPSPRREKGAGLRAGRLPGLGGAALRALLRRPGALNRVVDALGARAFGGSTLVLVFEGGREDCQPELARARAIAERSGGADLGEGPARHWYRHRYAVSYRQAPVFMMGAFVDTMEVAAPWSRLGDLYQAVRRALGEHGFVMAHLSHAYPDGCSIYFTFAGSAKDDAAAEVAYDRAWKSALAAAIDAGGTLSHHHGVGRSKAPAMGAELGLGIDLVRAVRGAFDPAGVLNPGNLVPPLPAFREPLPPAPPAPRLDALSGLIEVAGAHTLAEVERAMEGASESLGLGAGAPDLERTTVAAWIASGAAGAPDPWGDPVDQLVAGFVAELASRATLRVRPCPRRAVGPDLLALFHGVGERVGRIHAAHLRARRHTPRPLPCAIDRNPAVEARERAWIERVLAAAARV